MSMMLSSTPVRAPVIDKPFFFELLNQVLITLGREALDVDSPHKKVIEVLPTDRVLQILAGPGSGKTEALVWRVLYELFVKATDPARLLVTTFTNRAATELQIRVVERCDEFIRLAKEEKGIFVPDPQVHNLRIGTIHSLCDELLAEYDTAYVEAGTQVIDQAETSVRIARSLRWELGYTTPPNAPRVINRLESCDPLLALFRPPWEERWPSRMMERVEFVGALVAQHTETWIPRCRATGTANGIELVQHAHGLTDDLCKLQQRWEQYLDKNSILDFATIQKRFLDRQSAFLGAFDHVFVDEFQDSNPIQFAIHTEWLKNEKTRLTVVGDDDQAIYRFRGSDIECFRGLEPHCNLKAIPYRRETLATNFRSTKNVVAFTESFKQQTILAQLSMPKIVVAGQKAIAGKPVRLLTGSWGDLCAVVAQELDILGAGRPQIGEIAVPTVAVLAFSTSEKEYRDRKSPALDLRRAVESKGVRVYNPRNKTAGNNESPVAMLLGLISYLIDPVSLAPIGKRGGLIEVWASARDDSKRSHAKTHPPTFPINDRHAALQKAFIKADGGSIGAPGPTRRDIIHFVDEIRAALVGLPPNTKARLTLSGFVARLLAFPIFRHSGFTLQLFRQALFTQLLEANIAPTRLTMHPLDQPLEVSKTQGKFKWPERYWNLLSIFGGYLENTNLDDLEVEAFEEDAVLMITFHQAKGLEFDHIYVAATGHDPDLGPALRTRLFSGIPVPYKFIGGVETKDAQTNALSLADREREVYVAITRGRSSLTLLHDPTLVDNHLYTLNPAIEQIFASQKDKPYQGHPAVKVKEFTSA
jgi:DNA helicase-2/ATP-dependent DNA helicase PcrA